MRNTGPLLVRADTPPEPYPVRDRSPGCLQALLLLLSRSRLQRETRLLEQKCDVSSRCSSPSSLGRSCSTGVPLRIRSRRNVSPFRSPLGRDGRPKKWSWSSDVPRGGNPREMEGRCWSMKTSRAPSRWGDLRPALDSKAQAQSAPGGKLGTTNRCSARMRASGSTRPGPSSATGFPIACTERAFPRHPFATTEPRCHGRCVERVRCRGGRRAWLVSQRVFVLRLPRASLLILKT